MRHITISILLLWLTWGSLSVSQAANVSPQVSMQTRSTTPAARVWPLEQWQYQRLGDSLWHSCRVPSLVQECLLDSGLLLDPTYRDQQDAAQWVSDQDWLYQTEVFIDSANLLESRRYFVELDGVDTYADVYLNGAWIGHTESMFVGYQLEATTYLKAGHNRLVLHIHSPLRRAHAQHLSNGFGYPADNDHALIRYSPFTRKAPYHYGWDWGMRLVTIGIWQPARLKAYERARLESVSVESQIFWSANQEALSARLTITPDVQEFVPHRNYSYRVELIDPDGHLCAQKASIASTEPMHIEVSAPRLWWPHGWGEPDLYTVLVTLEDKSGQVLDRWEREIGIREITFVNELDEWGTSFFWRVNRRPIYIKGANYIPGDLLLTKRTDETFVQLMQDVTFANMNMLRIWGGGVYEDDRLYREADRRGVLIWQDFMFACTAYPHDASFLARVRQEAIYQIKRLRHHACLALWCGNNEVEEALKYWGWDKKYPREQYEQMSRGYDPLFRDLLPSLVKTHAPGQSYIHGSPMLANWGRPHTFGHGDSHYWGLWYGKQPFEVFRREARGLRFVSEFGFQSLPTWATIEAFTLEADRYLDSRVMRAHQKASTGNGLILEYLSQYYRQPRDFRDLVYLSGVLQARGMQEAIQTLRAQRPVCMGQLYWQLNDAWPALSWSSIDYYGSYKPMHYVVRRAYAPLSLVVQEEVDSLRIYASYDALQPLAHSSLVLALYRLESETPVRTERISIDRLEGNALTLLVSLSRRDWQLSQGETRHLLSLDLEGQGLQAKLEYYPTRTKDLELPAARYRSEIVEQSAGRARLRLEARTLLKDVCLELPWHGVRLSDNCFDLRPGESREIEIVHPNIRSEDNLPLEIRMMND